MFRIPSSRGLALVVRCRARELSLLVAFLSNDLQPDCLDQFPQRFLQLAQSVDGRYDAL